MEITVQISDLGYKQFKAALILSDETEEEVLKRLISSYVQKVFSTEIQNVPTLQGNPMKQDSILDKIPVWATRHEQLNHRIIQAYFVCEQDGMAYKDAMRLYFEKSGYGSAEQFHNNFSSMCSDSSQAQGKIFECNGYFVVLAPETKAFVQQYRQAFMAYQTQAAEQTTEEEFVELNAAQRKQQFLSWFRAQRYHGRAYNPVTISGYTGRIENACTAPVFAHIHPKNLFSISDLQEFRRVKQEIQHSQGFDDFDAKSHNGFTAALNKYELFLSSETNTASEEINAMYGNPRMQKKHCWTVAEDELCCRRFIEQYVVQMSSMDISQFIRGLENSLPDITANSLRMKLQNIKCLCRENGIADSAPIKPLSSYSAQSERAFRKYLDVFNIPSRTKL